MVQRLYHTCVRGTIESTLLTRDKALATAMLCLLHMLHVCSTPNALSTMLQSDCRHLFRGAVLINRSCFCGSFYSIKFKSKKNCLPTTVNILLSHIHESICLPSRPIYFYESMHYHVCKLLLSCLFTFRTLPQFQKSPTASF